MMCTSLSLYFSTPPSITTSMLCCYNNLRDEAYTEFNAREEVLIRVPLVVSTFPYHAFPVPKAGAGTTTTNLEFFRGEVLCHILDGNEKGKDGDEMSASTVAERDHGVHFVCMECPEDMARDMQEFFGEYYDA